MSTAVAAPTIVRAHSLDVDEKDVKMTVVDKKDEKEKKDEKKEDKKEEDKYEPKKVDVYTLLKNTPETLVLEIVTEDKEKKQYVVNRVHAAIQSGLILHALDDKDMKEFPVPGIKSIKAMNAIVAYIAHWKDKVAPILEKPVRSADMKVNCKYDEWDATFIDEIIFNEKKEVNMQQLYDLILGANYMEMVPLLHLASGKVATRIKGKPLEAIREILNEGAKNKSAPIEAKASEKKQKLDQVVDKKDEKKEEKKN